MEKSRSKRKKKERKSFYYRKAVAFRHSILKDAMTVVNVFLSYGVNQILHSKRYAIFQKISL